MTAIIKKEVRSYFTSITGFVFIGIFMLILGLYFTFINVLQNYPDFNSALSSVSIAFLILVPTITMRLFAEEMRQKTDQLLLTSPTHISSIIIGKYLAALALFLMPLIASVAYPFYLSRFGTVPTAAIAGTYIGFFLVGAAYIAVGLFISTLTENQIVSAVITFALLFFMFILQNFLSGLPKDRTSSLVVVGVFVLLISFFVYHLTKSLWLWVACAAILAIVSAILFFINNTVFDGILINVLNWFSLMGRFSNFSIGVLYVSDIVYYITFSALFIYLSVSTVEKRRWS